MNQQKTLVFLGAHPDDETFGPGATLAHYALAGVQVYVVCATRGEAGTVEPDFMKNCSTVAEVRNAEMKCAAKALGLADIIYLGYRDSGMSGSPDNKHTEALMLAPVEEVAGKIVNVIRKIKPEVIITHDAGGGYGHPDHIAVHKAVVLAFDAAANPLKYPESGPVFQPSKLYFTVRPRKFMKLLVKLMPVFGQDPRRFGRNKDIDLTKMMSEQYPVNAAIRLSKQALMIRNMASACHASQGGAGPRPALFRISGLLEKIAGQTDYFMRYIPPPGKRGVEHDLFE